MNKESVLYGIIGLLVGLIIGFAVTNYLNRTTQNQIIAVPNNPAAANPAQKPAQQVSTKEVKEQPAAATTGGAMMPQIQQTIDRATSEPNNFEAQVAAGDMYNRIKNFEKAIEFYQKANQIKPDDYGVLVKLGNIHFDKADAGDGSDFVTAEKWYGQALAKNPRDVNVRTDFGLTFYLRQPQDLDRAIAEYRKSLEVDPAHELTLQNLAGALKLKGDTTGLTETLLRLEKVNPNNAALLQLR